MNLGLAPPQEVPPSMVAPFWRLWRLWRLWRRVADRLDRAACALLALGVALRLWLVLRGWPSLDSDEALVGLMARHILIAGERPIFFYGQHYMGPLEAYLAAAVFRVTGPGTFGLRVVTLALTLGFLGCVYLLGRAAYGRVVGLLTLALLAVGPAFGLLRELPAIGGYQETLLLGAIIPLLVYRHLLRAEVSLTNRPVLLRAAGAYAFIGLACGLGMWSDELVLPFVIASVAALALARPREAFGLPGVALVAGTIVGGAPFWLFNLTHHFQTFAELSGANHTPGVAAWVGQVGSTLTIGLPTVMGSPRVCVVPGAVYADYASSPTVAVSSDGGATCAILNGAYSLVILAVLALVAGQLVRAVLPACRRWFRSRCNAASSNLVAPSGETIAGSTVLAPERRAVLWLRGVLLISTLATVALYTLSPRTTTTDQFVVARYLLPVYVTLPLVIGCLWEQAGVFVNRLAQRGARSRWRRAADGPRIVPAEVLSAGMLAIVALFFVLGAVEALVTASDSAYALPSAPGDARLIHELGALGVTAYYADYWTCYSIVFESGERLHCSTLGRAERYPPYAVQLAATRHPAYVLHANSAQDATFATYVAGQGHPTAGYTRVVFDGYAIYYIPGGQSG